MNQGRNMPAWMYILRLASGRLYVGSTRKLDRRYNDHFAGTGCRTTRLDPPFEIPYEEEYPTYSEALHREHEIKGWTRANSINSTLPPGRPSLRPRISFGSLHEPTNQVTLDSSVRPQVVAMRRGQQLHRGDQFGGLRASCGIHILRRRYRQQGNRDFCILYYMAITHDQRG